MFSGRCMIFAHKTNKILDNFRLDHGPVISFSAVKFILKPDIEVDKLPLLPFVQRKYPIVLVKKLNQVQIREQPVKFFHFIPLHIEDNAVMADFLFAVGRGHMNRVFIHQNQRSAFYQIRTVVKEETPFPFQQIEDLILVVEMLSMHIKMPLAYHSFQFDAFGPGVIDDGFHASSLLSAAFGTII